MGNCGNTHNLEKAPSEKAVCKLQKKRCPHAEKAQLFQVQIQNSLTSVLVYLPSSIQEQPLHLYFRIYKTETI